MGEFDPAQEAAALDAMMRSYSIQNNEQGANLTSSKLLEAVQAEYCHLSTVERIQTRSALESSKTAETKMLKDGRGDLLGLVHGGRDLVPIRCE